MSTDTRNYVACLSSYTNGVLHGVWIDCEGKSSDELRDEVSAMLALCTFQPAEEYAIHDSEGFYGLVGEHTALDDVADAAALIEEHGEAFARFAESLGGIPTSDEFSDSYAGEFDTVEEYTEQYLEDCGVLDEIPEHLRPYFDTERYARDLVLGGDIWTARLGNGSVAVFRNV